MGDTVVIDFETYYDDVYSLKKMSTEDYINDPRFEVIMFSYMDGDKHGWFSGNALDTGRALRDLNLDKRVVVAHNALFDCLILQERFKIRPGAIIDTLSLANAHIRPFTGSVSLAKCLEHIKCEVQKGDYVHHMKGRTRTSLSKAELAAYARYCSTDVIGTRKLLEWLLPLTPKAELKLVDMTARMYLDPQFELDAHLLAEVVQEEKTKKRKLEIQVAQHVTKAELNSNPKFAEALMRLGLEDSDLPRKVSPQTGHLTYAFAKNDPGFMAMLDEYEDHPIIGPVLHARVALKSNIAEKRAERLLDIALKYKRLRVPLRHYGAHTGRLSGTDGINMQNPPRVDKSRIRYAMKAPKGHVVLAADYAQIEARIVAWLSQCHDLISGFRSKADIYADFATKVFAKRTTKGASKEDDIRRFVGKTCILGLGYGMGWAKLQSQLGAAGMHYDEPECRHFVNTYRTSYHEIPNCWMIMQQIVNNLSIGTRGYIRVKGETGPPPVRSGKNMIMLPNDMPMYFPEAQLQDGENLYKYGKEWRRLFGGKMLENVTQALARIIVMEAAARIRQQIGLTLALQVHDELDYIVPEEDAPVLSAKIRELMLLPPSWATGLPLDVEIKMGPTFGDCK